MSGFLYLATPYSKYPGGVDAAHTEACRIAAEMFREGRLVYSPIAHTHAIEKIGGLGVGFEHWAAFDEAMIAAADGMVVAKMDGWRDSAGIMAKIAICRRLGKPVWLRGTQPHALHRLIRDYETLSPNSPQDIQPRTRRTGDRTPTSSSASTTASQCLRTLDPNTTVPPTVSRSSKPRR